MIDIKTLKLPTKDTLLYIAFGILYLIVYLYLCLITIFAIVGACILIWSFIIWSFIKMIWLVGGL